MRKEPCAESSAERGEPNGELMLCDPASLDRALAARPARSPISTGIPQESATFGNDVKARGRRIRYVCFEIGSNLSGIQVNNRAISIDVARIGSQMAAAAAATLEREANHV
jgi:hypothetical protein